MVYTPDDNALRVRRDLLNSRVVSLFLESALWGAFALAYFVCLRKLLSRKQARIVAWRNAILVAVLTVMFGFSVGHVALTVSMTMKGFVSHGEDVTSIYAYFLDVTGSQPGLVQYQLYVTQTIIFDLFMAYYLYTVWTKKRVVILSILLTVANAALGYSGPPPGFGLAQIYFFLTFATNLLFTCLLMWRLLPSLSHKLGVYGGLVNAVIQPAAIYTALSIALVVTTFVSPNIGYVVSFSVLSPAVGLIMGLIMITIARDSRRVVDPEEAPLGAPKGADA